MATKRVRREIQCICPDCRKGYQYRNGGLHECPTCRGLGEVTRYVVEVVHVDDAASERGGE